MTTILAGAPGELELPFTEMGKTVGGAGLGACIRSSVLDLFSLRTLGSIQVDMLN